jgi:hypothetical protein
MLMLVQNGDPLQVLAAAVTPVVMVSATAILISGVNSRYMRSLAHEYRETNVSAERRAVIRSQMIVFRRRVALVSWTVRALYAATRMSYIYCASNQCDSLASNACLDYVTSVPVSDLVNCRCNHLSIVGAPGIKSYYLS